MGVDVYWLVQRLNRAGALMDVGRLDDARTDLQRAMQMPMTSTQSDLVRTLGQQLRQRRRARPTGSRSIPASASRGTK